jgi:hypothetical protein
MIANGIPDYIRSDNGFCESFNGTFRDNLLDGEIFNSLKESQIILGGMDQANDRRESLSGQPY